MSEVIIGNQIKLYRNLDSHNFNIKADDEELKEIYETLSDAAASIGYEEVSLNELSSLQRLKLVEEGKFSSNFLDRKHKGFFQKENMPDIVINGLEHLEIREFSRDKSLDEIFKNVYEVEDKLEDKVSFSFDPKFGYLTSRVLNTGTGLRPQVILHLPALNYFGMEEISKGLMRLGYVLMPYRSGAGRNAGSVYTLTFESTFGDEEDFYINKLNMITKEITDIELENRKRFYLDNIIQLEDLVNRSFGMLSSARILSEEEMKDAMSNIKLGTELSILKPNRKIDFYDEVMKLKNGHLQIERGAILDIKSRDILRANKSRALMKEVFK
ncbi:ATP--guanido phosphotransferase [Peptoniphilus sp.]|jgi:protein arginine kinase|uniref:ATP--guanido phosphotransferase n=1 Tax=Peptoniphilus sp. TaxID=1971214 RepID=UPI003D93CF8E